MIMIEDCPLAMKQNITKQLLREHGSVRDSDSMRAGTTRGAISKTHAFDAISNFECLKTWIVSCHCAGAI